MQDNIGRELPKTDTKDLLSEPEASKAKTSLVSVFERWLLRKFLRLLGEPPFSFVLWNGEEIKPQNHQIKTRIEILSRNTLYKLLYNPGLYFGEFYCSGAIKIDNDLLSFMDDLHLAALYRDESPNIVWRMLRRPPRRRSTTLSGSKDNIHRHYDLGNEFYQLWLDKAAMQYTCAYYPDPAMALEQAQIAKMHHVCRKIWLQPGETVAEAGCGWGGLALFMAKRYGVTVKAYNISHEQVAFARERAVREALSDRVEYIEDDYRNIRGQFDVFVSVGMLEHVGPENYRTLGAVIDHCLKDSGRGLVHSVGGNTREPMNEWLEKRIFPGSYVPTLREMMEVFEPFAFSILDVENLRLHYAKTLKEWLHRFDRNDQRVHDLYDETFVRTWRLYLAGCSAAFTTGALQLYQVVFARPHKNDLPWSRQHLYGTEYDFSANH